MFHKRHQKEQIAIIQQHGQKLASEIKRARLEAGISRNELATRAGVSRPTISKIEDGNSQPTTSTLMKLIYALELNCVSLFSGVETELESKGQPILKDNRANVTGLDESLENALMKLRRKSKTNPDLRSTVIHLAELQTVYAKLNE